jgi:uncharacterized protein YjbI with pentapeptide repeats
MLMNAMEKFYEKDVAPVLKEILVELEEAFQEEKQELRKGFVESFKKACQEIQDNLPDTEVGFIMYNLLRTKVLQHEYTYSIIVYDEEWYMKEGIKIGEIDVSFAFKYFEKFWQALLSRFRKYVLQITIVDVEHCLLQYLEPFHQYVLELMRYSLLEIVETKEYKALNKAPMFRIEAGEFYEPCDTIHIEEKEKNSLKIQKWLEKNERKAYWFQDFTGLDFSKRHYTNIDLSYADLRESILQEIDLSVSVLMGTKFKKSNLAKANLTLSMLHNATFEEANLEGANLSYCVSFIGKNETTNWKTVGFTGTSFKGSNLKDALFKGATLSGVDFTGAILENTDFEEATLYRSQFTKSQLKEVKLSKEQLAQIKIVE